MREDGKRGDAQPEEGRPAAPSPDWFYRLRGLLRGMYDEDGGGEAWLRRERGNFGGPNDK